jgi:L-alanine-DL-glutamate epimerase-like enolase superfamily enzyme
MLGRGGAVKIVKVEIFDIHMENAPVWHPIILRATTDEGITGLGEVGLAYGTGHSAGVGMARNLAESFGAGRRSLSQRTAVGHHVPRELLGAGRRARWCMAA